MKMKRLVWGFFTIAAVALLAGCGGGGGTSLMVGGDRATQDAIDALEARPDTTLTLAEITALMGRPDTDLTLVEIMALMGRPDTDLTLAEITALMGRPDTDLTLAEITALMGRPDTDLTLAEITALTGRPDTTLTLAEITDLMGRPDTDLTLVEIMALMGRPDTNLTLAEITALMGRPDTTLTLAEITDLMGREDITPAEVQGLKDRITHFETAQNARDNATGAAMAADEALTTATTNMSLITTRAAGVAGNSAKATENARSVLTAKEAGDAAVVAAQDAVDAVAALAPDADADTTDALTRALNAAIAVANTQLAAAQASANDPALTTAVQAVTGTEDNPMTPEDYGRLVAEDITAALEPTSATDGSRARGDHGTTAPDATAFPDAVMMDNAVGMTWAEIVTDAGKVLESLPVTATGGGTELVDAASFAGMAAAAASSGTTPTGPVDYGTEYTDASYMGIAGRSFCAGSDCSVDDDSNLTGSWYFTPTDVEAEYVGTTDDMNVTTYAPETLYAQFGHWLTEDTGNTAVNTYAMTGGNTSNVDLATTNFTDLTATYSGKAAGMSSTWTTDEDNVVMNMASGAFTATVNLMATFDDTNPSLTGTIDNFAGPAVDSTWSVDLASQVLSSGNFSDGATSTGLQAQSGVWTAQVYGADSERPTGFFGGFDAHFTDGHAAGAYAARE